MRTLAGVLCCVCFSATALATLASPKVDYTLVDRKDNQGVTLRRESVKPDGTTKGSSLEVVSMRRGCSFCDKMAKTTIPSLRKAGYRVKVVYRPDDTRKTKGFPTLYYIGKLGQVTRVDIGYRNYKQVIKHLEKP